jgi:low affinity Fe/Cu permease
VRWLAEPQRSWPFAIGPEETRGVPHSEGELDFVRDRARTERVRVRRTLRRLDQAEAGKPVDMPGNDRPAAPSAHGEQRDGRFTRAFDRIAAATARRMGHPAAFFVALGLVLIWAISGPLFGFSDTWQLIINTGTTVLTFLIVFLIQNSVTRDSAAVQLKLDELIRVNAEARDALIVIEHGDEGDIEEQEREERAQALHAT